MQKKILITISIVTAVIGLSIFYVYKSPNTNILTHVIASSFNLPIAKINSALVHYRQFDAELRTLTAFEFDEFSEIDLRAKVWEKLKEEYSIGQIANDLSITYSQEEIDSYTDIITAAINETQPQDVLTELSLSRSDFAKHIALPLLLRDKVNQHLVLYEENNSRTEIEAIYAQFAVEPEEFESFVIGFNEERSLNIGGEVIVASSDLSSSDRVMLENTEIGELTPIIAQHDGYRIYKVLNFFNDPENAWQLYELYIPTNVFQLWLDNYLKKANVQIFAPNIINVTR